MSLILTLIRSHFFNTNSVPGSLQRAPVGYLTEKILAIRIRQLRCLQGTTGREHEGLIQLREGQHGVVAVGKRGSWLHLTGP